MARQSRETLQVAEWLSPAEAADRLGVSVRKLQYMAREGEVERKRDGRRSLYWVGASTPSKPPSAGVLPTAAPSTIAPQRGVTHVATMTLDAVTGELPAAPANRANVEATPPGTADAAFEDRVLDAVGPELDAVEAAFEAQIAALRAEFSERLARLERSAAPAPPAGLAPPAAGLAPPAAHAPVAPLTGYGASGGVRAGTEVDDAYPGRPASAHFNSPFHAALEAASRGAADAGYARDPYGASDDAAVEAAFRTALTARPQRTTPGPIRLAKEAVGWLGSILGWFTGYRPR